jgi:SAM-dependent methyltransferase
MNRQIKDFVRLAADTLELPEPIYEFGSRQMPGQELYANLRPLFKEKEYVGADYIDGPGVDLVLDLRSIDLPDNSVGSALCMEVIEHVNEPFTAMNELYRVLKPGGVLVMSAPMNLEIHGSPYDYWRFTPEGFKELTKEFEFSFIGYCGDERFPSNVVCIGVKEATVDTGSFLIQYKAWNSRWSRKNKLYHAFRVLKEKMSPYLPAIMSNSAYELWVRNSEIKHHPKYKNFLYLLIPSKILILYKKLKKSNNE